MNCYKRNIDNKLLFRRLTFVLSVLAIIYLFSNHLNDYAVLLLLIVLLLSVFPVMAVCINNDSFEIRKYYLLGLIPLTRRFHKTDDLQIFPLKTESEAEHPYVDAGTDSWLDILLIFLPTSKTTHCILIIKYFRKNRSMAQLQENFTAEEFTLIINVMRERTVFNNFNNDTV